MDVNGTVSSHRHCPVCAAEGRTIFYRLSGAPVSCASVFADAASARAVPRGEVELTCCNACGFIYNPVFDPRLAEVGARYESSQASSPHFGGFARALARDWVNRYALAGKRVAEIGCGQGEFLAELIRAGAGQGIGFDPVAQRGRLPADCADRIELRVELFDERHTQLEADAVVCRHTLEHISEVSRFLRALRSWAEHHPHGVVLFEVPATERVLAECAFWDVYYEHCSYFTRSTLEFAFRLAGFKVLRTALAYDDQYLLIEATAAPSNERPRPSADVKETLQACIDFGERARRAIDGYRFALRALAAESRPLVVWQGAAKTVGFLTALADDRLIDYAIDVSPNRQGYFLPPTGLPVLAPDELRRLRPKHVVLMNPVYHREVSTTIQAMGIPTTVLTVNQLYTEEAPA